MSGKGLRRENRRLRDELLAAYRELNAVRQELDKHRVAEMNRLAREHHH